MKTSRNFLDMMRSASVIAIMLSIAGCDVAYREFGGRFVGEPADLEAQASDEAKRLIAAAFADIEAEEIVDYHVHAVAIPNEARRGADGRFRPLPELCPDMAYGDYAFVSERRLSWRYPVDRFKTGVMMSAAGTDSFETFDEDYARRLLELVKHFGPNGTSVGRFTLYAIDAPYDKIGAKEDVDASLSNDYVIDLAKCLNDRLDGDPFIPVASIHPNRRDAIEQLDYVAGKGVRYIKWLPPSMNIDPSKQPSVAFYREIKRLEAEKNTQVTLLVHTGNEHTFRVNRPERQALGDPLLLKAAIDVGVTVVMLHSGRAGPGEAKCGADGTDTYFDRFMTTMRESTGRPDTRVFGEIAAVQVFGTACRLADIAAQSESFLKCRMVNGSDYPNPAIALLNPTDELVELGWLTDVEAEALDEIYGYNPLLFDFVLKRTLGIEGKRLPSEMFLSIEHNLKTCARPAA